MRPRLIISLAGAALALTAVAAVLSISAWRALNEPLDIREDAVVFNVASGSTLTGIANELHELGLLATPRLMNWYGRVSGAATQIQAGEYRLEPGLTPVALIEQLVAGEIIQHQFAIIEGWTFSELLAALREHPAITATSLSGPEIMLELGRSGVHPEGQFMPDTYSFTRATRDIELLRRAHAAMQESLQEAWDNRHESSALESPYDLLILASIIEKETALAAERELISGVLNRRLHRGIRLQTDPTVIYGLGEDYDGNIRRRDLETDTPYNTYTRPGLPPTPIALPGRASLQAAGQPADGDALFFVATGLGDGSHYFSATLDEHNEAVNRYLLRQRSSDQ